MTGSCVNWAELSFLTSFFRFVSWFGDGVVLPVLVVALAASYYLFIKHDRIFALVVAITPLVGHIIKSLLKNYFQVSRPELYGCRVLTTYGDKYSFPSGHTIFYVLFFGLITYYYLCHPNHKESKFLLYLSVALILLIGISRVYLGAHWYMDILGGYLIGGTILIPAVLVYNRLSNKRDTK